MLNKKYRTAFIKKKYSNQIDEIKQLKKNGIVIADQSRKKALSTAEKKFQIAILDDGLQQKDINYDIKIVCFNSKEGIGNNFVIPSGPLREKLSEIQNYDLIIISGENKNLDLQNILYLHKKNQISFSQSTNQQT